MSARHVSRSLVENISINRSSNYICRQCRGNRLNLSAPMVVPQHRRYASNSPEGETFMEKTRKKLWKGQPPGPENIDDVYGGPGFFATVAKERRERKARRAQQAQSAQSVPANESASQPTTAIENELPISEQRHATDGKTLKSTEQEQLHQGETVSEGAEDTVARAVSASEEILPTKQQEVDQVAIEEDIDYEALAETELSSKVRTWDGLEIIGHKGDWREMPISEQDDYTPWQTVGTKLNWTHDELLALMTLAREQPLEALEGAEFQPGDAELQAPKDELPQFLRQQIDLRDQQTFRVLKNFSFLTRHRIPDAILTDILNKSGSEPVTYELFLQQFAKLTKPKPAKVAEILAQNDHLTTHSNLLVLRRRETPVDKEKEVGRWKVIEAELKARGLPALGKINARRA